MAPSGVIVAVMAIWLLISPIQGSSPAVEPALAYLSKHGSASEKELLEFAAIPSISSLPAHSDDVQRAAEWVAARLTKAGFEGAKVLATEAKTKQPVVYAEWLHAPGKPTVIIYGHYDVQPVDPLDLWDSGPFDTKIEGGFFWGRGISDDKGAGILPAIQGIEAVLQTAGTLPVNVKFLVEGQEEIGSPNLVAFLEKHKDLYKADYAISADGGQISETQGGLALALRGATAFEVEAQTLKSDVHSGTYGGTVQNSIHAMATFVAGLHLPNGSVAIPGFYDGVREITAADKADLADYPFNSQEHLDSIGALEAYGEEGFSTLERTWHRPTLDVIGMTGGFIETGVKTIVPAKAMAKVTCRLVADQDPLHVLKMAEKYVESVHIPGTKLVYKPLHWQAPPYLAPRDSVAVQAAAKILQEELGTKPIFYRVGGSIPATAFFKSILGIDTTIFAFGLSDSNIHAPNERHKVTQFHKCRSAYAKLLPEMAALLDSEPTTGSTRQSADEL